MRCVILTTAFLLFSQLGRSQCPLIQNLPDTVSQCNGTTIQLNPSLIAIGQFSPFDTFWTPSLGLSNPNVINPIVSIGTTSAVYKLTILALSPINLVSNGDFSGGISGFTSSYTLGSGGTWGPCSNPATYGVTNNPINMHSLWSSFGDHTSGIGQMLTVNGAQNVNVNVWCQTVAVTPGTLYDFSTWIASLSSSSPAILQFAINGSPLGAPFNALGVTGQWAQFHNTWFSGGSSSATICITNQNTAFAGNDFALDDIEFREACTTSDSIYVNVKANYSISSSISICQGSSVVFAGQTITTAGLYSNTFTSIEGCDSTVTLSVAVAAPYNTFLSKTICQGGSTLFGGQTITSAGLYKQTFTSSIGCDSFVSLSVSVLPAVNVSQNVSLCYGGSLTFGGQTITSAGMYTHTFTSALGCDSIVNLTVSISQPISTNATKVICRGASIDFAGAIIDTAGIYTHIFKTINGCDSIVTLTVSIAPDVYVDFSFAPTIPVMNEPTTFSNLSVGVTKFLWDFGDSTSSNIKDPTHLYHRSGVYNVCLTGWNSEGCKATKCRQVEADIHVVIDVPSGFTPNGDGINDILYVRGAGIKEFSFKVFNRWGQKVFETNDLKIGWDGRYNGLLQNVETFGYVINAIFFTGETTQKQGNISLL